MTTEERDVPELPSLLEEIEATVQAFDKRSEESITAREIWIELKNTILPLFKDFAASTMFALEDIRDLADPVELSGEQAQDIGTMLQALAQSQPTNPELQERVREALEALDQDSDEGDDEGDEEAS